MVPNMKHFITDTLLSFITTIVRRAQAQLFLVLVIWLGFTVAIALTVSIPVYAEAAGYRMLITAISENQTPGTRLPPFALIFKFGSATYTTSAI
jgi:putative ABC transport system permease protein